MPVIYLDVLIALNLFIDFLLLTAVAAWGHLPHQRWRLIAAAGVGAVAACTVLLPPLPWWGTAIIDIGVAAVMVRVAFAWHGWRGYGKSLATLYLLSSGFSGICTLIYRLFSPIGFQVLNGTVYYDIPPITLVLMTVISYAMLTAFEKLARPKLFGRHTYRITVELDGKTAEMTALYDSGNLLTETFSGAPVIVAERRALENWQLPETPEQAAAMGFRMIPTHTVDGDSLRPAFKPHRVMLQAGLRPAQDITGVYIAVADTLGYGEFQAVIGTPVIELLTTERMESV